MKKQSKSKSYFRGFYESQKRTSRERGIEFLLTFEEWYNFWFDSGHLHERGRCKGQYCMARYGDIGPYALGNIKIILHSENAAEFGVKPKSEQQKRKIAAKSALYRHSEKSKKKISETKTRQADEKGRKPDIWFAFKAQRNCDLTFEEWFGLWEKSGMLDQRGRGPDQYCLCRPNPNLPLSLSNYAIVKNRDSRKFCKDSMSKAIKAWHVKRAQAALTRIARVD